MTAAPTSAPTPDLRIVPGLHVHPHEEHDSQRSLPLIEQLQRASVVTNPPLVAPMGNGEYVILDGANRCYVFNHLGYEHILVQVIGYDSGYVGLENWHHVVGTWNAPDLLEQLKALPGVTLAAENAENAVAWLHLRDGRRTLALCADAQNVHQRNTALRAIVKVYQRSAKLHRTAVDAPEDNWRLFPDGVAQVVFPRYLPADIIAAARDREYLPPGISRHVVHGRALSVNYPLELLRDKETTLEAKNAALHRWVLQKMANRQVRYYAEATYQFNEYE